VSVPARAGNVTRTRLTAVELGDGRRRTADQLATEEPMEIRVDAPGLEQRRVAVTMRTPGHDFELAAGFLFTEGIIAAGADVGRVRYCDVPREEQQYNVVTVDLRRPYDPQLLQRNFYTTSSCGVCGKASIDAVLRPACARVESEITVSPDVLVALPDRLREAQAVFESTGGLHAAGLFTAHGELLRVREDVGRHNAMDKLIGASLLAGELPWRERIVLVSGRLSFELVQKAARAEVAVLAGVSAPSSLAVELAEAAGITLCGFVRGEAFNVYAGGARIARAVHSGKARG
jgi:FdhD protein